MTRPLLGWPVTLLPVVRHRTIWVAACLATEGDECDRSRQPSPTSEAEGCDAIVQQLEVTVSQHKNSPLTPAELYHELKTALNRATVLMLDDKTIRSMRVSELQTHLTMQGLSIQGRKAELVERLLAASAKYASSATPSDFVVEPFAGQTHGGGAAATSVIAEVPALSCAPLSAELRARLAALAAANRPRKGPQTGIFTDGSCNPNPGPGGWGVVAVCDGEILWSERGEETLQTTNNRMELIAIIAALSRTRTDETAIIYSDSNLCVQTLTKWAAGWERNNWRRANGAEVSNIDLVRNALTLARDRPGVRFEWLRAHAGYTWNEYADTLAGWREGNANVR